MSKIYVIGHVNPDTDAIASATGYAWLLNNQDDNEVVPARVGSINVQTAWVLDRIGLEPPELLADASPRFISVTRRLDFSLLMITDVVDGASRILMQDAPIVLDELPYKRLPDRTLDARGVVSRKKQLLPVVLALLEE